MIRGLPLPADANVYILTPAPAAGAQFTYTFLAGYEYLLTGIVFRLVDSAFVIARYVGLVFTLNGLQFPVQTNSGCLQNETWFYVWLPGRAEIETVTSVTRQLTLPFPLIFKPGDTIRSTVINMQAADQLDYIFLSYLRMPLTF
jgi:hypothetical protein